MNLTQTHETFAPPEKTRLDIGLVTLNDCAPLVIAHEKGFFEAEGLDVRLHPEQAWASVRDKILFDIYDAAQMLYPTPLATLHKFNGFADAFLNTPAVGLRDYYATLGTKLPEPFDGKVLGTYHHFTGDDNDAALGRELDLVATHRFNPHVNGLIKWAYFDGKSGRADIHRLWLEVELKF